MRRTSALIVGGGPAGSSAALVLASAGATPVVIDRAAGERDVVCGGFLGWDSIAALERLGVDVAALGARPIKRLRIAAAGRTVEARLPGVAAGLSRRRLDSTLLRLAEEAGAVILRGRTARSIDGDCVRFGDDEVIAADAIFLATGKHELRGAARETAGASLSVGLRAALKGEGGLARNLDGTIELHLFDGGYAGLLVQEDGAINLCLSVSRSLIARAGSPEELVDRLAAKLPLLARRLAESSRGDWEAIAGVPYGWSAPSSFPGRFRVGDQAAVIASLAGDGIAIALTSGQLAAQAYLAGGAQGAVHYQSGFADQAKRPLQLAEFLRAAAERPLPRALLVSLARMPGLAAMAARQTRIG